MASEYVNGEILLSVGFGTFVFVGAVLLFAENLKVSLVSPFYAFLPALPFCL